MHTHLAYMLLALQPLAGALVMGPDAGAPVPEPDAAAPMATDASDLRIVAVEQVGRPPYVPRDGRVYRLGGGAISEVRLGEMLIVRRPGEVRDIGVLRVVSVHTENFAANSALARLESKGETFPLKGDLVTKLAPTRMPEIKSTGAAPLKDGIPPPLDPPVLPGLPGTPGGPNAARAVVAAQPAPAAPAARASSPAAPVVRTAPATRASSPATAAARTAKTRTAPAARASSPAVAAARTAKAAQATKATQPAPATVAARTAPPAATAPAGPPPEAGLPLVPPPSVPRAAAAAALPPDMPKFLEQNPIYFAKGSSEISPKGLVRLREWTDAWGVKGLTYFLSVPQSQLQLQRLVADRLAALQGELARLGVGTVDLRHDERDGRGPFDVVYVGVEGPARL